jgi:hypothetical protein
MTLATVALAPAYDPASWRTYFTLTGTAAATLTGLFFLAFSLRLQELQLSLMLRTRARYLLTWLVMITIGSAVVVIPGQSRAVLAAEIIALSAGCIAYTVWSVVRAAQSEPLEFSVGLIARWFAMAATWLLSIGAGISLLVGGGGGLYFLAFALLLGIALEVAAAWNLIVSAGQDVVAQDHAAEPPPAGSLASGPDPPTAGPGQR